MPRLECYACRKPASECLCALVPRIEHRTGIHILQHPRERDHAIGTIRIVRLGLPGATIEVPLDGLAASRAFREVLPPGSGLLYPRAGARELRELPAHQRPPHLVLLDGTWAHARSLYRANPWLAELPHYRLTPEQPSRYRIRREPAFHCISTLEAVISALQILEPGVEGLDQLLAAFVAMIDRQIDHETARTGRPRWRTRRPRGRPPRALVEQLGESARTVLVYGEIVGPRESGDGHRILHWVAERPATGEIFSSIVRPLDFSISEHHLERIGLTAADLEHGCTLTELVDAWRKFMRPEDVLVAWNRITLERAGEVLRLPPSSVQIELKRVHCNLTRRAPGHLEDLVATLGLAHAEPRITGRAGRRLALVRAILDHLIALPPVPGAITMGVPRA